MFNLIKAELKKIFRKKSFLIVTIIFILYCLLTNVIYKEMDNILEVDETYYTDTNISNNLDLTNQEDLEEYLNNKTKNEINDIKKNNDSSMEYIIDNYLYNLVYEKNKIKYTSKDEEELTKIEKELAETLKYINNNDWEYFVNLKITNLKAELKEDESNSRLKELISLNEYRLTNKVDYSYKNYLNNAIIAIETDLLEYYNFKSKDNLSKEEQERYNYLQEEMALNNYILKHKVDANNTSNLNAVLKEFPANFGLFILIYVIMISGSIVSEEFNKGTIKYLLTKPHKRSTILASKLLTVLLLIPLIIIFMCLIEILIGGFTLGFNSLNIPILIYNSSTNLIESYSVIKYLSILLITTLPEFLILGVLCFLLSTITTSTSAAITITFLFYLMSNVISNLALMYNLKIFNYFIALHWNFNYLLTKTPNPYNFKPLFSLGIIAIYLIVMLCLTFIYFNKKDVKNI